MSALPKHLRRRTTFVLVLLSIAYSFIMMAVAVAMLLPEASGKSKYEKSKVTIDYSNSGSGYIMVKHSRSKKIVMRVSHDKKQYDYYLSGDGQYETFPLQTGSGSYNLQFFEQVSGKTYTPLFSTKIKAEISDENSVFLYPNQYVNYTADTKAVAIAEEICAGLSSDKDKLDAIYGYVVSHIAYDHMKALQVKGAKLTQYLPDVDEVLSKKLGICFDYAAVFACMLRSQGIPARLEIGAADKVYHAWNQVYIEGEWVRRDTTYAASGGKVSSYTVERTY